MKACRQCRFLMEKSESRCLNCNSTDLSEDYSGMAIIIDPENSEIAKKLNVTKAGQYALRVR